jgi:type 1 fimbria pilin
MKNPYLIAASLAGALLASTAPVHPEDGRVVFAGSIVEPACSLREGKVDCPPGRQADAAVRPLDMASARRDIRAELFAYALQRDPSATWQVVDVVYH